MRRTYTALFATVLTSSIGLVAAGPALAAGLDDTFGTGGFTYSPTSTDTDRWQSLSPAPGGGTAQSGFSTLNTSAVPTDRAIIVQRLDKDGVPVATFGPGGPDGDGVVTINVTAPPFLPGPVPPAGGAPQAAATGAGENSRGLFVQPDGKIVVAAQAETVQDIVTNPGKADYRDRDVYVFRLNTDGSIDTTFNALGTRPGFLRVDMSSGVNPANSPTAATTAVDPDECYGVRLQPDGKIIVEASKGLDAIGEPGHTAEARLTRPWAILRINTNGTLDTTWGASHDGIALSPTVELDLNARQPLIEPDGKVVAAGYTEGSIPHLARFNSDGTVDTTFGNGGVTLTTEGQKVGDSAEAYDTAYSNGNVVMVGYGRRHGAATGVIDALIYRFTPAGLFDTTWGAPGSGGLTTFDRAGGQDRFRELTTLPDGRFVAVGLSSSTATVTGVPDTIDGLLAVVKADGTLDTSVGAGGTFPIDLGGNADGLLGSTTTNNGTKVVAAGFKGFAAPNATQDDPVVLRLDLTQPVPGPVGAPGPAGTVTPVAVVTPAPTTTTPTVSVVATVTCKRVGSRTKTIRCTTKQTKTASGTVKITLKKSGKTVGTGKGIVKNGASTVTVKGTAKAGKYSLVATLPGKTIKKTITVR